MTMLTKGPLKSIVFIEKDCLKFSFDRSFKASDMGWRYPAIETFLGPFRKCMRAMIFRSIKVKNTILRSTLKHKKIDEIR